MAIGRRKTAPSPVQGTFELHGLEWTAPDRIEVNGAFARLEVQTDEPPVLVVHGADASERLRAVPETVSGAPAEGQPWRAEFAWDTAPFPFEAAALEFADGSLVALGALGPLSDSTAEPADAPPVADDAPPVTSAADHLHLQAELLAAQAAARDAAAEVDRLRTEVARATQDVEAERARSAADAERFREGLESVQRAADAAVAEHKAAAEQLGSDLLQAHEAVEARDAELATLRSRVAELEQGGKEAALARADTERAEAEAQRAREESERLAGQLARIREALDGGT
jgi:hypothetical protein